LKRGVGLGFAGLLLLLLAGCGSTTVFQSSFDSNTVGAPPSHNQSTGTINVSGAAADSVAIVTAPPNATGKWAQIKRSGGQGTPISTMQCDFSQYQQDGSYGFAAVLFIPSGSGLATLEFDTSPQTAPPSTGFLHLDFGDFTVNNQVHKNTVRIDDDNTQLFGTFPRDQYFSVTVSLNITSASAIANINLFGTGASGVLNNYNIVNNVTPLFLAEHFGEVKFFMGSPWDGSFDTTTILVTRKN
jgi:hypothetical protein